MLANSPWWYTFAPPQWPNFSAPLTGLGGRRGERDGEVDGVGLAFPGPRADPVQLVRSRPGYEGQNSGAQRQVLRGADGSLLLAVGGYRQRDADGIVRTWQDGRLPDAILVVNPGGVGSSLRWSR